jgi:acetyl esterase
MSSLKLWPGRVEAWIGGRLLRLVFQLPDGVLRRLAGPVPPAATGLDPGAWLVGRLAAAGPDRTSDDAPVAEQRKRFALQVGGLVVAPPADVGTVDYVADGVPVRLYTPAGTDETSPLLVYYHGGGWVHGSVATHDGSCRWLAAQSDVRILSVDYRLAPEHVYPAAVQDAVIAYRWAAGRFPDVPLAVGGDSAGGNLAAVVALTARDDDALPDAAFQLLLYPVTDVAEKAPSYTTFSTGYVLTESGMDWFKGKYLADEARRAEWQASPLRAADLSGLPPAYVASCLTDVLRDEGEAYAARLREAGVPVALQRHDLVHGFFNMLAARRSRTAISQVAGALRQGLARS